MALLQISPIELDDDDFLQGSSGVWSSAETRKEFEKRANCVARSMDQFIAEVDIFGIFGIWDGVFGIWDDVFGIQYGVFDIRVGMIDSVVLPS